MQAPGAEGLEKWGDTSQRMKTSSYKMKNFQGSNVWHGLPCGSDSKASACNAGNPGSIPGSGRSPGEENGTPLQSSCLENSMDGRAWWAAVHGITKSQTQMSDFTFTFFHFITEQMPDNLYLCAKLG